MARKRGGLTSTKSFSKVVHVSGVGKLELSVCAARRGVVETMKHENRPAKKKTESKQVVITFPCTKGYCLSEALGIHSGSQVLLPVRIVQGFYDDSIMLCSTLY